LARRSISQPSAAVVVVHAALLPGRSIESDPDDLSGAMIGRGKCRVDRTVLLFGASKMPAELIKHCCCCCIDPPMAWHAWQCWSGGDWSLWVGGWPGRATGHRRTERRRRTSAWPWPPFAPAPSRHVMSSDQIPCLALAGPSRSFLALPRASAFACGVGYANHF
jgi:hypothetical protein